MNDYKKCMSNVFTTNPDLLKPECLKVHNEILPIIRHNHNCEEFFN